MDRPVIFSAPMIKALLDGRKSQTRRLAWQAPRIAIKVGDGPIEPIMVPSLWQRVQPGDRLWVRENMKVGRETLLFCADDLEVPKGSFAWQSWLYQYGERTIPSVHMPRWASRLTLTVTEVRRQRLQEIDYDDCIAEGFEQRWTCINPGTGSYVDDNDVKDDFRALWIALHGRDAWTANPEVIAISFRCERRNIDAQEAA